MFARLEEVATYDDDDRLEGLQFDGRERRLQQWREKQEDAEFERLVAKLRQHKNYRAWYERRKDDPDFRERLRAHCRQMRAKHGQQRNAEAREKYRQDAEANPVVNVCQECGTRFTREFGFKRKRTSKFCTRSCRNRHHGKRRYRTKEETI